jgi:hypothetical protein
MGIENEARSRVKGQHGQEVTKEDIKSSRRWRQISKCGVSLEQTADPGRARLGEMIAIMGNQLAFRREDRAGHGIFTADKMVQIDKFNADALQILPHQGMDFQINGADLITQREFFRQ